MDPIIFSKVWQIASYYNCPDFRIWPNNQSYVVRIFTIYPNNQHPDTALDLHVNFTNNVYQTFTTPPPSTNYPNSTLLIATTRAVW